MRVLDRIIPGLLSKGIEESIIKMLSNESNRKKFVTVRVVRIDDSEAQGLDEEDIISAYTSEENYKSMRLTSLSIDFDLLFNAVYSVCIGGINTAILCDGVNNGFCFIYYYDIDDVDFTDYDFTVYQDIYKASDEFRERFQKKNILYTINRYNDFKNRLASNKEYMKKLEKEFEEFMKKLSPEELLAIEANK